MTGLHLSEYVDIVPSMKLKPANIISLHHDDLISKVGVCHS